MATVSLSLLGGAATQFFDNNGNILSGGKLYSYAAGTTTPKATYTTSAGNVQQTNPMVLSSYGRVLGGEIWLIYGESYKFVLTDASDNLIGTWDDIVGGSISTLAANQVTYTEGGTGSVATDVQTKLRQYVSIKDFGAVGDGLTNDTTAWKAFVNYLAANGGEGLLNKGTYLVDNWSLTLTLNSPFTIRGEGKDVSILKRRGSVTSGILGVTTGNYITFSDFTIDNNYTGDPASASSGATLFFYKSSYITLQNIRFRKPWKTACLVYNDWQDTQLIKYGHIRIDGCDVFADSGAYSGYVGPSAFLLADVNDSQITNCYIENIGLYGYEFKNDCSRTLIDNCIAKNTYYPFYYGGDGAHTELGYVKDSQISNCTAISCRSGFVAGLAWNNVVNGLVIDNSNIADTDWKAYFSIDIRDTCKNNTITNVTAIADQADADTETNTFLVNVDIPAGAGTSLNNYIELSTIRQGSRTDKGISAFNSGSTGNTVIFGNRDSTHQLFLDSATLGSNTAIDQKLHRTSLSSATSELIRMRLGSTDDDVPDASKGIAWSGVTDSFWVMPTGATHHTSWVGNQTAYNKIAEVYTISPSVSKTLDLTPGGPVPTYVWATTAFYPGATNAVDLGGSGNAWNNEYFRVAPILTSDANQKQQIRELDTAEKAVAARLKLLIRAFKFNDAVAAKGDEARTHIGIIAQDVKVAFESEGLDAAEYGIFCSDILEDGTERLGVRYEELLAFIIAAM